MTIQAPAASTSLPDALALGSGAMFELLADNLARNVGYRLLTILVSEPNAPCLSRVFSTNETQYPLGAADPIEDTIWFRRLFSDGEAIVANDSVEIDNWLPGFDAYVDQGYGSLANVPVVVHGATVGLLNLMDVAGHFTAERVARLKQELPVAALAIFAARIATQGADLFLSVLSSETAAKDPV